MQRNNAVFQSRTSACLRKCNQADHPNGSYSRVAHQAKAANWRPVPIRRKEPLTLSNPGVHAVSYAAIGSPERRYRMKAMVLEKVGRPLRLTERETPRPGPDQILVEVGACAVCRTDLHVVDGDLPDPRLPVVPGHEIVGRVIAAGKEVSGYQQGDRVGIPWLGHTCGSCGYCRSDRENLCDAPGFTGYQIDGGFPTHAVADAHFCLPIPNRYDDVHAAPLLCAGLIGYRSLKMAG